MPKAGIVLPALVALGAAIWGVFFLYGTGEKVLPGDTPGPNLVIEVGGATSGVIVIDLLPNIAPKHVERIVALANEGAYDNVVFHRVIADFMAQTGDVQHGKLGGNIRRAGTGNSDMPDLQPEFTNVPFTKGTVGMARSTSPDSANSQFFIMFDDAAYLNGQYTVIGRVIDGADVLFAIKLGDPALDGVVTDPDYMKRVTVTNQ